MKFAFAFSDIRTMSVFIIFEICWMF